VAEPNQDVRILLRPYSVATVVNGTLTIIDDDGAGIDPENVTVREGDGPAKVVVRLDAPQPGHLTVKYKLSYGNAEGPFGDAYFSGTLDFSPGELVKEVVVPIEQNLITGTLYRYLTLFDASPNVLVRQRARITILDDGDFPSFTLADAEAPEGRFAELSLTATPEPATDVLIGARIVPGTATAGVDFKNLIEDSDSDPSTILVQRGWDGETTFYVGVYGDHVVEGDETFDIELFNVADPAKVLASSTVTIKDTNSLLPILSVGDASVREGKNASFSVTLSRSSDSAVSFRVRTVADTAESGVDFEPLSEIYTLAPGETSLNVEVKTITDASAESHETFAVELSSPWHGQLGDGIGRGRIFDDEEHETPLFDVANVNVSERGGAARFTVTRAQPLSTRTSIAFATINGTAIGGADFVAANGSLTFEAGETSKTVDVVINDDAVSEADETFTLRLADGTEALATITNDDARGRGRSVRH
jgi:hypothetical protein